MGNANPDREPKGATEGGGRRRKLILLVTPIVISHLSLYFPNCVEGKGTEKSSTADSAFAVGHDTGPEIITCYGLRETW